MDRKQELIEKLKLQAHPEGGYFRETYRSEGKISRDELGPAYSSSRNYATCIYFMLTSETFSAFHKINQDEIWHFYEGAPIVLHTLSEEGKHQEVVIGNDFSEGQRPQLVVPGGNYFAARVEGRNNYALVGCTVAPGFDFDDFVLPTRQELIHKFPQHENLIKEFTRI